MDLYERQAWHRANGQCECLLPGLAGHQGPGRCEARLMEEDQKAGGWVVAPIVSSEGKEVHHLGIICGPCAYHGTLPLPSGQPRGRVWKLGIAFCAVL